MAEKMQRKNAILTVMLLLGGPGEFSFANIYNSNMVLQKAPARAKVWGYAEQVF